MTRRIQLKSSCVPALIFLLLGTLSAAPNEAAQHQYEGKLTDDVLYGFKYGNGEDSLAFTIDLPKGWAPWVKYVELGT